MLFTATSPHPLDGGHSDWDILRSCKRCTTMSQVPDSLSKLLVLLQIKNPYPNPKFFIDCLWSISALFYVVVSVMLVVVWPKHGLFLWVCDIFPTKLAIIANLHLSIHPHLALLGTGQTGVTLRTFCDRSHLRTERNFGAIFINYLLKIIQIVFAISFNCSCPRNATSLIGFALGWQKFKSKLIKDAWMCISSGMLPRNDRLVRRIWPLCREVWPNQHF